MRHLIRLAAALCLALLPSVGSAADDALARFRAASGGDAWRAIAALRSEGTLAAAGLEGNLTQIDDLRDGRTRTDFTLGPISGAQGFDGTAGWRKDPGGNVTALDSEAALRGYITAAWFTRRAFWNAGETGLGEEIREAGGRRFAVVGTTPPGGEPLELWIDTATGLLDRIVVAGGAPQTTRFADYRPVAGVLLPFHIEVDNGDPAALIVSRFERIEAVPMPAAETFAAPVPQAGGAIANADGRTTVPFALENNHIYLEGKVDGQPVRLMLDTGALNVLTPQAAERLGLKAQGQVAAVGTGERATRVGMARAKRVEIGGAHLDEPLFYIVDMDEIMAILGTRFDGLVGYELLQRYVAEVDYAGGKLGLIEPEQFAAPADASAVPIEFDDRTPIAPGKVDGIPARFTIDTGSRGTLTVHSPFVRKHGLVERYGANIETTTGYGVGGGSRGRPVRFGTLHLGDIAMDEILGSLSTARKGALAESRTSGNVGGGLLKRFVVTFDYGNRRMYLKPNGEPVERQNYDRLGSWLMGDGEDGIRLGTIIPGGAAERAGLQVDDRLLAVDGTPVAERQLEAWRKLFRDTAAGTAMRLTLRRGAKVFDQRVELLELVR